MGGKKRKTILRTIRLSEDVDALLEKDAEEQNISGNAFISKIMTRYVEWERTIENTSYVTISGILFRALINEVSDEKLEEIGRTFVAKAVKELAMVAFGKTDFESLLNAVLLVGKYDTGMRASVPSSFESRVDGLGLITLYHDWGLKGSILLRGYFDSLVRNELGRQPTISVADDAITVSFPRLSKTRS